MEFVQKEERFLYMIGVEPSESSNMDGMEKRVIPPQTYAIFRGNGKMPDSIQETWRRIFGEWFPATEYEHAGGPELEVYPDSADENGNMPYEVWIPV